jgi:hypothetical protein
MSRAAQSVTLENQAVKLPGGNLMQASRESHFQPELQELCGPPRSEPADIPVTVVLRREPDNKEDRNAIQLVIGPYPVGYVDRVDAVKLAPCLDELWTDHKLYAACAGRIKGGSVRQEGSRTVRQGYEVELDILAPEEVGTCVKLDIERLGAYDPRIVQVPLREAEKGSEATPKDKKKGGCLGAAALLAAVVAALLIALAALLA